MSGNDEAADCPWLDKTELKGQHKLQYDPIFELIQECKGGLMPGGRKFIRSVNFETSPAVLLLQIASYRM